MTKKFLEKVLDKFYKPMYFKEDGTERISYEEFKKRGGVIKHMRYFKKKGE